jgi:hypothetical protein
VISRQDDFRRDSAPVQVKRETAALGTRRNLCGVQDFSPDRSMGDRLILARVCKLNPPRR